MQPKVSVVVPSWFKKEGHDGRYGRQETFYIASECLNRFIEVTPKELYQLILIDNGSDLIDDDINNDNIRFKPSWYWEQADILIKNKKNLGYGPACNQGIAVATGEYILNMNNDIVCWDGFVEELLDVFNQLLTPPVGMAMPALEKSGIRFPEIMNVKKEDIDMKTNAGQYGSKAQFGSAWLMKKSLLDELFKRDGFYFDPQFEFLFKEDRDLYERVYQLGYMSYRTHNIRVKHIGNLTVSKFENHHEISAVNRERFNKKWNIK